MKRCSHCGAENPADAPDGRCVSCLLALGVERDVDPDPSERADLTPILLKTAPPLVVKFHSFGDYELLGELARGGMGVVFRARQLSLNRIVALKFIHPGKLNSPEATRRFQIEAEAAASLNHPNIVTIYSVEQVDSIHFLSMELVEGHPLNELIPPGGFELEQFFALAIPLADALAAAHARGIGHRDLKPSNVMVNEQGRIKVIDFGLAKLVQPDAVRAEIKAQPAHQTGEGQILGTPAYMSPEQIEGRTVNHLTDVFSLGILLCEMATAQRPFQGGTSLSVMSSILRDAPQPLAKLKAGLPEQLGRIIGRCLQKDLKDRYPSALEVRNELKGLAEETRTASRCMLTAPKEISSNLPVQLTSFIGREHETSEVIRLLVGESVTGTGPAGVRLLTLTGPGGTGKTRLALQAATGLVGHFPDGVWFVELAALADPSLVAQTVASALGLLNNTTGGLPLEPVTRFLASKQTLLLLDNCEHIIAACADLADALLRACPRLQILATSREGLRLTGETVWPVPSLSVPAVVDEPWGGNPLETLGQYESVKLFAERARAAAPAFALSEQNVGVVAQLCHRLDGIPLAIELAAARTRLLTVEQLLDRVRDRFRLLTGGSRTALPRQRTLRALVDWSYDLLASQERLLFDRLSVFAGGWTLEAAEAVCVDDGEQSRMDPAESTEVLQDGDVLDLLGRLLEKSMVVAERSVEGKARYRLLETLRQYAQERLAARGSAATETLRTRHATHFAELAEEAAAGMHGPDQAAWLARLELEHDNLRTGLEWGKAADAPADRVELALRLAAPLYLPWLRQGHGREGRQHFETLLAHQHGQRPGCARAQVLFAVGSFALWQHGEEAIAWTLLQESLSLGEQLKDSHVMADAHHNLGVVLSNRGDNSGARRHHEEALRLTRADGDVSGIRWSLEDLADCADEDGQTGIASQLREEALTLARQSGDHHGIASILQTMGNLARINGKVEHARELIGEALSLMQRIGCQHCSAGYLAGMAFVADAAGEPERTVQLLGASEALRERTGFVASTSRAAAIEKILTQARRLLGETAYRSAWSEGLAMSLPQATAYALGSFPVLLQKSA